MRSELDVLAPAKVLYGLVAAVAAWAGAVLTAAIGQGLGAVAGGCGWIGLSTPVDRQVWALVNQPTLHFASQGRAFGYWTGSTLLLLAVALLTVPYLPHPRTLAAELAAVHTAWAAAAVGLAWLPFIDPTDGHLWRWVELWHLPQTLAWLAPALAIPAAMPPTLRLLALLRASRHHSGRLLRIAVVGLHLVVPAAGWVAIARLVRGTLPVAPTAAVGVLVMVALAVAWFGYPPPFVHRLESLSRGSWLRVIGAAAVLAGAIWMAGRPVGPDRRAGLLWGHPQTTNNVRPWIEETDLTAVLGRPSHASERSPL